ncbi:MAG: hypothetical protein ACLPJH_15200 [Myxococcaceae bacterium]
MPRLLLLVFALGALAFGLPSLHHLSVQRGESARENAGLVATSAGQVPFTLYWPDGAHNVRTLVVFAADARAQRPQPLRLLAEATAATGVAAVYLAPSEAPDEAAVRLKALLERHAAGFGLKGVRVWTWVEGQPLGTPATSPCSQRHPLLAAVHWLGAGGPLLQTALELALNRGCPVSRHL